MSERLFMIVGSFAMKAGVDKGISVFRVEKENGGLVFLGMSAGMEAAEEAVEVKY